MGTLPWIAPHKMSDYVFSDAERWAVFTVQGDACYVCRRPLDLFTMEIDHVLPESLLRRSDLFEQHRKALGLAADFNINGYENWLPICNGCNKAKSDTVFAPSLLIQSQLQRAKLKSNKAQAVADEIPTKRQLARSLGMLLRGISGTPEERDLLLPLIQRFAELHPDAMTLVRSEGATETRHRHPMGAAPVRYPVSELRLTPTLTATFVPGGVQLNLRATGDVAKVTRHRFADQ